MITTNPAIMGTVEKLGYRVTAGDVASQIGLNIAEVNQNLLVLASQAGGHLQVADTGDIVYQFPENFRDILRNKYLQIRLKEWWEKIWSVLFYLIRISFGIFLIISIILITLTITIILTASSDRDNNDGNSSFRGFNFFFFPDLFWYFTPGYEDRQQERRRERGENYEMNFLEAVFSFLFGDGNPNANLEARRWQEIGTVIRANKGAIVAEQITPYLDDIGARYQQEYEDYMLPILVKFNGRAEVSDQGQIIYYFPELQVKASKKERRLISEYLHEFSWRFSQASSGQIMLSAGLGVINFVGAIILGVLLGNGVIAAKIGGLVAFVQGIYGLLLIYGIGFLAIPIIRYFWIKNQNSKINSRNKERQTRARLLANADNSLQRKIAFAREFGKEKVISEYDSIYSSDRDLLEQELEEIDN